MRVHGHSPEFKICPQFIKHLKEILDLRVHAWGREERGRRRGRERETIRALEH